MQGAFFTSLGSGHFTQALNLVRHHCAPLFPSCDAYDAEPGSPLDAALRHGVPSLVLSNRMTWQERKFVSVMLNKTQVQRGVAESW